MNDVIKKKSKYVQPSLLDGLLLQQSSVDGDNSYYIKSDITIMKELSGQPDKFTPAQQAAINARATMSQPTHDGTVDKDVLMSNIVPRDAQTLNERKAVSDYFANQVLSENDKRVQEEERQKLFDSITQPPKTE